MVARIISSQKIYGLYGLKHHIVETRGGVTDKQTTEQTLKIELLSQWKLEAEFRNNQHCGALLVTLSVYLFPSQVHILNTLW